MFSLNFMFFCSLIEELCTKEENYKTSCNFNFGHECTIASNEDKIEKKIRILSKNVKFFFYMGIFF